MSTTANYASTPRTAIAQVSAANTARDGTGANIVTVITGASTGTRVDDITITGTGTVASATVVRLFLCEGSTNRLFEEILVPAHTPSTTVPVFSFKLRDLGILLANNNWNIKASVETNNVFNIHVTRAGDF